MILRTIRLANFRKYRSATVAFPEGLVGIVGPNGAGKSTLFEAAAWALFGNGLSRTGGFGLAGTRGPCEVELEFEHAGELYRIRRRLTGGGQFSSARIHQRDVLLVSGSAADRSVCRLLGADAKTFLKTVYCRQGEIRAITTGGLADRHSVVLRILGLDLVDRAIRRIREDESRFSALAEDGRDPPADVEAQLADARMRLSALREEARKLPSFLQEQEPSLRTLQEIRAEIAVLTRRRPQVGVATNARGCPQEALLAHRASAAALERRRSELARRISSLRFARDARCPLCRSPIQVDSLLNRLREEETACRCEARTVETTVAKLRQDMRDWERHLEWKRRANEREKIDARISLLESRAIALNGCEETVRRARERLAELEREIQEGSAEETRLQVAQARQEEARRRRTARERRDLLRTLRRLLQEFHVAILDRARPVWRAEASAVLSEATEGRFTDLRIDPDLRVRMGDGGSPHVLTRFSGGEQDVAGLALRLGLSRLLAHRHPVDLLVLDEILAGLDRERRRAVLGALRRLPLRQTFLITHLEEVQESIPTALRVTEDPSGFAEVRPR